MKYSNSNSQNLIQEINFNDINEYKEKLFTQIRKILNLCKTFLLKIRNVTGIRHIVSLLKTLLKECPISKDLIKKYFPEDIDKRIERIKDVKDVSNCLEIVYYVMERVSRILTIVLSNIINIAHFNLQAIIFEGENEFMDKIERSGHLSIYKHIYQNMISEGISPSYTSAWIILLACLSPLYYFVYVIPTKMDATDSDFYNNPLIYDRPNDLTGITKYEKQILKITKKLIDAYKEEDNEFDKEFILAKEMIIKSITFFVSFAVLIIPTTINITGLNGISIILQMLVTFFTIYCFIVYLIFSSKALEISKKDFSISKQSISNL